jgi:polysaccharide export outer membrane protein
VALLAPLASYRARILPPPPRPEEIETSFEDFVRRLVKALDFLQQHAHLLVFCTVMGAMLGAASLLVLPPARKALCEVTLHPEIKVNPVDPDVRRSPASAQFFVDAERAFMADELIRSTLIQMGFKDPDDGFVLDIRKRLKFEKAGAQAYLGSMSEKLLRRDFRSPVELLATHLKNYVETEIQKKIKVFVAEVDFLRQQVAASEKELADITAETVKFREKHADEIGKTDITPSSRSQLQSNQIALTGTVRRLEGELDGLRDRIKRGGHLAQAKSQAAQPNRDALIAATRKLAELRAQGLADEHPEVRRAMEEKQFLDRQIEAQMNAAITDQERNSNAAENALRGEIGAIEAQLTAARSERAAVGGYLRNLRQASGTLPFIDAHLDEMARRQDEAKRLHAQLYERLRRAEVQLELERVSVTSRYEVTAPPRLERTSTKRMVVMRAGIGVLLGLLTAFLVITVRKLREAMRELRASSMLVLLAALLGLGCAHQQPFVWLHDLPAQPDPAQTIVQAGDTLLVEVAGQTALSGELVVREDGHFLQPMLGSVLAAGQTPAQIANTLDVRLKNLVTYPVVKVWLVRTAPIRVSVVGEVKTPGTYELQRERSLMAALAAAGWLTEFAHADRLFVVRNGASQTRLRFSASELTAAERAVADFRLLGGDVVVVE